jgi:uncharacterized protein YuzE
MEIEVTYDDEANAAYMQFAPGYAAPRMRQVWPEIKGLSFDLILDIDPDGRILGLEIIGAREALREDMLRNATEPS